MTAVSPALLGRRLDWSSASSDARVAWIDALRPGIRGGGLSRRSSRRSATAATPRSES